MEPWGHEQHRREAARWRERAGRRANQWSRRRRERHGRSGRRGWPVSFREKANRRSEVGSQRFPRSQTLFENEENEGERQGENAERPTPNVEVRLCNSADWALGVRRSAFSFLP